jgi:predicted nucleic-acid-binding protein
MRTIDTSILVRLIVRDDARQTAAAENYVSRGAWISHLVLAETVLALESVYGRGAREIAAAIELLLDSATIAVQEPATVASALTNFRENPSAGFSDCLILEIARKHGHVPLGTFDRALAKQAGVARVSDRT